MSIDVVVAGAAGRTGRRIVALCIEDREVQLAAALECAESGAIGTDAGELAGVGHIAVPVADRYEGEFDVLIDFSLPRGTMQWLAECTRRSRPIVIGTTGHGEPDVRRMHEASKRIAVLKAPNMSVGINVLLRLARQLGAILDASYDVEITEAHHRFKVDAPSGTALALRDAVCDGRGASGGRQPAVVYGRHGEAGPRPVGQIGIHSLRIGDTVGEHAVSFGAVGETITIGHEAHSRDTFAAGALRAAKWVVGRPAGMYDMQDVLFGDMPET
ncbi:MAG: 4-hydroxy-tetrahydrodipicolinate reductase [Phycisphaerae bacterium]|nr:4-hydroxy-tetrahydrodipicolinate reductase [Phycisphaerae bacterium]